MKNNKTKRIKQVFTSHLDVLHRWANQTQDHARSGNVFYHGTSCFSYGRHYELGRLIDFRGQRIALINSSGYSNTAARHIRDARDSVKHLLTVDFPLLGKESVSVASIRAALVEEQSELIADLFDILNQRSFYSLEVKRSLLGLGSKEESEYSTLNKIGRFNDKVKKLKFNELEINYNDETLSLINSKITQAFSRSEELRKQSIDPEFLAKKQAEALKRSKKFIDSWMQGGPIVDAVKNIHPQIVRVKDDSLQTSRGASVPLSDVKKLIFLLNNNALKVGHVVGPYTVNEINEETIKINCHVFNIKQCLELLKEA